MKKHQLQSTQKTLLNFFSKKGNTQNKSVDSSISNATGKNEHVKKMNNEADQRNDLSVHEEKKKNKSNKDSALSFSGGFSTGRKDTLLERTDSTSSPTKKIQTNLLTFTSPSKEIKLDLNSSKEIRNEQALKIFKNKPNSLKVTPRKRKFNETPPKESKSKYFSSPTKCGLPLKNYISGIGNCNHKETNETLLVEDVADFVDLAEDSIIISPQKISVKRQKLLLKENSSRRTLNFKNSTEPIEIFDQDLSLFFNEPSFDAELKKNLNLKELQRCEVIAVNDDKINEKLLTLKSFTDNSTGLCILRSPWNDCEIFPKDIVSLRGSCQPEGWVVDWNGLLITNPDKLISGTTIVGSVFCMRKTVLSHIFRERKDGNRYPMVLGNSVHQLFQEALKEKHVSIEEIEHDYDRIIHSKDFITNIYLDQIDYNKITNEIHTFIEHIHNFMQRYVSGYETNNANSNWCGEIVDTPDIEENIWSPVLGMKGKVDATVRVQVKNKIKTMPLELKTGKVSFSIEHRGQVILYCMLLKQLGYLVDSGLLLYLSNGVEMKEIKCEEKEMRDLTLLRNGLCHWLIKSTCVEVGDCVVSPSLPSPINRRSCSSCPYLVPCYAAVREKNLNELRDGHLLKEYGSKATAHLSDEQIKFVFHWLNLIYLEKSSQRLNLSDIWTVHSDIREKSGKCLAQMKIDTCVKDEALRFMTTFSKSDRSLLETELTPGQLIVVSSENHIAHALGIIQDISPFTISVMLDKHFQTDKLISLDAYDSEGTLTILMNNLSILLEDNNISAGLRESIIDLKIPKFSSKLSSKIKRVGEDIFACLNKEQVRAVLQAISAENYILIKGMPGAGKTTTMAALVELLTRLGLKVLVTSFTHSALDNILINLIGKVNLLRLGPEYRIHPRLKEFTENSYLKSLKGELSTTSIDRMFATKDVVGVTCYGCKHLWVERQVFDVCLVDEAAQVSLPAILKPISLAKKFILVGDPKQLPALVVNNKAKELGFGKSLFEQLDRPAVTSPLTLQYRMNRVINALANDLTYNGQLKCANQQIEEITLSLPEGFSNTCPNWLKQTLSTELKRSVVVLDVESNSLDSAVNQDEAKIVFQTVAALVQGGVNGDTIGVIAPYNRQVLLLRSSLDKSIEVNTVDQYQGRDKDVIIFSTTRSKPSLGNDILGDWNRLNVAVTRAKKKLIILGNLNILSTYDNFSKLLSFVDKDNIFKISC